MQNCTPDPHVLQAKSSRKQKNPHSPQSSLRAKAESTPQTLLEAALANATRGWPVFPCHTPLEDACSCQKGKDCSRIGKHPRTTNGLKDATTDEERIRHWWTKWPDANIGLVAGHISGLVILDVDGQKNGYKSLVALEQHYGALPETVMQSTGRGSHIFFAHPGVRITNDVEKKLGPGLDIRGDGGYIIAAPSLHVSRKRYASGRNTVRATVGREFPTCTFSVCAAGS